MEFKNYLWGICEQCWCTINECECISQWMTYLNPKDNTIEYGPNEYNEPIPFSRDRIVSMRWEQIKELISNLLTNKYVW